jgi:hypothetical protein
VGLLAWDGQASGNLFPTLSLAVLYGKSVELIVLKYYISFIDLSQLRHLRYVSVFNFTSPLRGCGAFPQGRFLFAENYVPGN